MAGGGSEKEDNIFVEHYIILIVEQSCQSACVRIATLAKVRLDSEG